MQTHSETWFQKDYCKIDFLGQLNRASRKRREGNSLNSVTCQVKINKEDIENGFVAQLNRAPDYGSGGYRFESCRGHYKPAGNSRLFLLYGIPSLYIV